MTVPQANATLTTVTGASAATGGRDDWDDVDAWDDTDDTVPAGDAPAKWEGSVRAYYSESLARSADGATQDTYLRRRLILETVDADVIDTDDVITLELDDRPGEPITARARLVERRRLARIPSRLQTTRLELDAA